MQHAMYRSTEDKKCTMYSTAAWKRYVSSQPPKVTLFVILEMVTGTVHMTMTMSQSMEMYSSVHQLIIRCSKERVTCLAPSSAGQTGDHHVYRLTEGNTAQGILAADITKPDVSTFKVLQPIKTSAWLSASARICKQQGF